MNDIVKGDVFNDPLKELEKIYSHFTYMGNTTLCGENVHVNIPSNLYKYIVQEIVKCKNDPLYFAQTYYTILSPEKGKHIIQTYPKQDELIMSMINNNRLAVLAARQSGKCVSPDTYLEIRNTETGVIEEIKASDFHELLLKEPKNL